jgi:hypothetical protein
MPAEAVLQPPWLADPEQRAHHQRQVEPGHVHQQPFEDLVVSWRIPPVS